MNDKIYKNIKFQTTQHGELWGWYVSDYLKSTVEFDSEEAACEDFADYVDFSVLRRRVT